MKPEYDFSNDVTMSDLQQLTVAAGRPVFEQGTPSFQAYFIEEGRLEVTVREGAHIIKLAELGPGEIFGEMGVLEHEMRMATVVALEPTKVRVMKRDDLEARIAGIDDQFVRALISAQTQRLRESNRGQMQYYKRMADLQNRLTGLADAVERGVDPARREEFKAEILPLMTQMEAVLKKFRA